MQGLDPWTVRQKTTVPSVSRSQVRCCWKVCFASSRVSLAGQVRYLLDRSKPDWRGLRADHKTRLELPEAVSGSPRLFGPLWRPKGRPSGSQGLWHVGTLLPHRFVVPTRPPKGGF